MSPNYYNTSLRNLTYRLRAFKDKLPLYLEEAVMEKEDAIVEAIAHKQLYNRGINGRGVKIKSYRPYSPFTVISKAEKGQPYSRVTLRDTGMFYAGMHVVYDSNGFYVTSDDLKTEGLVEKYGPEIFRLTDQNLSFILKRHIREALNKKLKAEARQAKRVAAQAARQAKRVAAQAARVAKFRAKMERDRARLEKQAAKWRSKGKTYL